jgi:hypothetical protein
MWTERARMFRKTCELIADDRRATRRDDSRHRGLVQMMDACAADLLRGMKRINRVLDAHLKG